MFLSLLTGIFILAGAILKGLALIFISYIVFDVLIDCIEIVWEIVHPRSLQWVKSKFKRKIEHKG